MKTILKILKKMYRKVLRSIAFYPVVISFVFLILAIACLSVENWEVVIAIKKKLPYLFIQDFETARSMLSTLIGGIISLTVFSFSMVMVVLSQASSNFSPRLLPGLISNKRNQIILGIYIGTLLNCIIVLISLGAYGIDSNSLGLSTMLAALSGVLCIVLFVYFIHGISQAIQIHNIIERIFHESIFKIDCELKNTSEPNVALCSLNTENWAVIKSRTSGYFKAFDISLLENSIKEQNNQIDVLPYANEHIWEGDPVIKTEKALTDKEYDNLIFCLHISSDRHEGNQGIGGMIKLMEIAVKAMSPGINDPGTAIEAINKLGILVGRSLQMPTIISKPVEGGNCTFTHRTLPAAELMRIIVQPIRFYSKHDVSVLYELIGALQFMASRPNVSDDNRIVVDQELGALHDDIKKNIENKDDKERILKRFN